MPNIEYVAPWYAKKALKKTMPHELWETLSPHAQRLCRYVVAEPGVWPAGAGVLHPLASKRREAVRAGRHADALPDAESKAASSSSPPARFPGA
jgi:hypothetical protein